MKIVIQCAGTKKPSGFFRTADGRSVKFVAHPELASASEAGQHVLAHPDDDAGDGRSWRDSIVEYNQLAASRCNPLGLWQAAQLYSPPAYADLGRRFGKENVFILSAGWGLLRSSFLTPNYDITFSRKAKAFKRRRHADSYRDFCQIEDDDGEPIIFLGGKDYLPLFCTLTSPVRAERIVYFNAGTPPDAPGCRFVKYETMRRTNWHYDLAADLSSGKLAPLS